jgi:putative FmdB family regulatory protein
MPLREYHCNNCNSFFELLEKMNESATHCPKCSSPNFKKLISKNTNFRINGKGVYKPTSKLE